MQNTASGTPGEDEVSEAKPSPPPSLAELFAALEGALLVYAQNLVKDNETAQDIVQEAFIKLHRDIEKVRQPRPWLYRTVHNLAMNQLRSRQKLVPMHAVEHESQQWPDNGPLPDAQITRLEAIGQTRLCLEALDARSRELVRLKFEEGLSYQEISQRANLSISNVGYVLHHALKRVGAELKKLGFMP
jgi:RNA polymerase sigma factor (sigma-70 family)